MFTAGVYVVMLRISFTFIDVIEITFGNIRVELMLPLVITVDTTATDVFFSSAGV